MFPEKSIQYREMPIEQNISIHQQKEHIITRTVVFRPTCFPIVSIITAHRPFDIGFTNIQQVKVNHNNSVLINILYHLIIKYLI